MNNYTKQDYERDLQIVADAPKDSVELLTCDEVTHYMSSIANAGDNYECTRSLQDIRDKIAMYESNQKLIEKMKSAYEYLDSFLETEVNKDNYVFDYDITVDNNVDFNEARIALEELTND